MKCRKFKDAKGCPRVTVPDLLIWNPFMNISIQTFGQLLVYDIPAQ